MKLSINQLLKVKPTANYFIHFVKKVSNYKLGIVKMLVYLSDGEYKPCFLIGFFYVRK